MLTLRLKRVVISVTAGLAALLIIYTLLNSGDSRHNNSLSQGTCGSLNTASKSVHFYERNISHYRPSEVLLPYTKTAPDTIHLILCGRKWLEFKHFLALLSIMKVQQPSKVIIHYWKDNPILRDKNDYNLWYSQLGEEYYNIMTWLIGDTAPDCSDDDVMTKEIMNVLKNGGIYINDTVMLTQHIHNLRYKSLTAGIVDSDKPLVYTNLAFLIAKKGEATLDKLKNLKDINLCSKSGK